jgi:uncharacterized protein YjbI with pentapeptide repeats
MVEIRHKSTGRALLRVDADTLRGPPGFRLLRDRNLAGADLRGFDFHQMDLSGTDLRAADLSEADLTDTNLVTADLTGAELAGALYNQHTRWPAGFDPEEQGAQRAQ